MTCTLPAANVDQDITETNTDDMSILMYTGNQNRLFLAHSLAEHVHEQNEQGGTMAEHAEDDGRVKAHAHQ